MNIVSLILLLIIIGGICGIVYIIVYNNLQAYTLKINEAEGLIDELLRKKYDDILMMKDIIIEETDVPEKSFDEVVKLKKQNLSSFDLERKLSVYNNLIVKINSDYDMYYNGGEYATIDYLNINGLYIVCQNAIRSLTIDGASSTIFEGAGVLIPIATLQKFETLIVITDMNNNVTHYSILNLDYALKPVTYDSWHDKLIAISKFNNWYSFAFYTCFFLQESLTRTDGIPVDVKNQIQYMSLLNEDFYNTKGV